MIKDTSSQDVVVKQSPLKKPWLVASVVVLGLSGAIAWPVSQGWFDTAMSVDSRDIQVATVERGTLVRDISATGKIVAANAPVTYSPDAGYINLLVEPGDQVETGQIIASLDSPELVNQLKQQQATLQSLKINLSRERLQSRSQQLRRQQQVDLAQVSLNAAEREFRRATISSEKQLISAIDYEKAQDDLSNSKLQFEHAKQEAGINKDTLEFELQNRQFEIDRQQLVVAELERRVANLEIRSKMVGIVGNWLTEQQSRVNASQPLMKIVDLSAFEAEVAVPESYVDELGLGMTVEIKVAGNQIVGTLAAISPEVRERQVSTRVRFSHNNSYKLRQNQRLSARILLENKEDVLMVKRGPFVQSHGGKVGYLLADNLAVKTTIELGSSSISHVELLAGAKEGDQLVISTLEPFESAGQVLVR